MYVKSVLAGVTALLVASVLYLYIYAFWILAGTTIQAVAMRWVLRIRSRRKTE